MFSWPVGFCNFCLMALPWRSDGEWERSSVAFLITERPYNLHGDRDPGLVLSGWFIIPKSFILSITVRKLKPGWDGIGKDEFSEWITNHRQNVFAETEFPKWRPFGPSTCGPKDRQVFISVLRYFKLSTYSTPRPSMDLQILKQV